MSNITEALASKALERASIWIPVKVRKLPEPERCGEIVMLGSHSYALVESRRRLIHEYIEIQPAIIETPSAIARDYLRIKYKRGPRATRRQYHDTDGIPPVPSAAIPRRFAHGYYLDIRACYWSIMMIAGWDVDYSPGLWISPGQPPDDFPFADHKIARNCLVSAGRLSGIIMYNPKRRPDPYSTITRGNDLQNNQLPRLIHDILNSIAYECLSAGAIYYNNDGMIAPSLNVAQTCEQIIADWGLTTRIKAEGEGEVKGSGTYRVGPQRTLTYEARRAPQPLNNVYPPPYRKWLQNEFSKFAAVRKG